MMTRILALALTLPATSAFAHGSAAPHTHDGPGALVVAAAFLLMALPFGTAILSRRRGLLRADNRS
jgi:hypothetical protein